MYYVENSHPAIIEREIFDKVQEEIARRNSKKKEQRQKQESIQENMLCRNWSTVVNAESLTEELHGTSEERKKSCGDV